MAVVDEALIAPTLNRIIKDRVNSLYRDPQLKHASVFVIGAAVETLERFYDETSPTTYKLAIQRTEREVKDLASAPPPHALELNGKEQAMVLTARLREMARLYACVSYMLGDVVPKQYLQPSLNDVVTIVDNTAAAVKSQQASGQRPTGGARRRLLPHTRP